MIHSLAASTLTTTPVILYGAGECSHWFVEIAMKRYGIHPIVVVDQRFGGGESWYGIPACHPDAYRPDAETMDKAVVIVAIGDPEVMGGIRTSLEHAGFADIVPLHDLYEIHNPFGQPDIALVDWLGYFEQRRGDIDKAAGLMADEESRAVFDAFVRTHMTRRPVPVPRRSRNEQYFPRDVPLVRGHARYVCCGAYDGDTLRLLSNTCGRVEAIACFEPEPAIYGRLLDYLRGEGKALAAQISTWPNAVYGSSGLRRFLPGDGLGSRLDDAGPAWAQCVSLDDALPGFAPSFISMDIEGAEPAALRGAERLLRRYRPDLGICVYHAPAHVWEIPLYLSGLGLGYRFYLRNYTGFTIETVLYATAPDPPSVTMPPD